MVRGVVRCDRIDRPVRDALDHGLGVTPRPQRRIHLGVGVVVAYCGVFEHQMVWGHFAGDPNLLAFGFAHEIDRAGRRDVCDVHVSARILGQQDIALNHDVFRDTGPALESQTRRHLALVHHASVDQQGVLAMIDDRHVEDP